MASKQTPRQRRTIGRVMHESKHGELRSHGRKVKNPRQAIAIALSEAGASRGKSRVQNRRSRARTERRENEGRTASRTTTRRTTRAAAGRSARGRKQRTFRQLYAEAKRKGLKGRSYMSKAQLERALHV